MRTRQISAALVLALALAACGDDDQPADDIDLGADAPADPDAQPDPDAEPGTDAGADDAGSDDAGSDDAGSDDAGDPGVEGDLVDTTKAEPGTWPVGDAGTVTFAIEDGRPVLVGHTVAEGWDAVVDVEDDDELEVDFRRDGQAWDFEVEVDEGILEVEIYRDLEDADPGSYDLPDGGAFAFDGDGSAVTLSSVTPGDGWEVGEQEQDDDSFEFTVTRGDRRVEVEVEADDGRIEVEIDYRVRGELPA